MSAPTTKELKTIPLLTLLRAADLKPVARVLQERAFSNRQYIFREGAPARACTSSRRVR